MDIDSILEDDLDIEILEVKLKDDPKPQEEPLPLLKKQKIQKNPVEEHLMKQIEYASNQIDLAKNNIEVIQDVTGKIVQNLASRAASREDNSSDSESDLYTSVAEPAVKYKKNRSYKKQVLIVKDTWQRVIDDKWIIGFVLQSTTTCALKEPTIYVCLKNRSQDSHGVSIFWTLVDGTFWFPTEEIESEERLVATAVLDLPTFDEESTIEAQGTVFCQFDDKLFQTPLPLVKLSVRQIVDGSLALELDDPAAAQFGILALKATSVDKVVLLPVHQESNVGKRLLNFLDKYAFKEICKVCVVRNAGSLQYCVLEVLPSDQDDVRILLSARSEAQLSVVVQLMSMEFPELLDVEKEQAVDEAAEALRKELKLYLSCNDAAELQRARIKTDLLIP